MTDCTALAAVAGVFALTLDGVTVTVTVRINAAGETEQIGIEVPVDYYLWPADAALTDLPDGQSVRALILGGVS